MGLIKLKIYKPQQNFPYKFFDDYSANKAHYLHVQYEINILENLKKEMYNLIYFSIR